VRTLELEDALGLDVDIHSVPDPKRTNLQAASSIDVAGFV
jgi:hypothetical protein